MPRITGGLPGDDWRAGEAIEKSNSGPRQNRRDEEVVSVPAVGDVEGASSGEHGTSCGGQRGATQRRKQAPRISFIRRCWDTVAVNDRGTSPRARGDSARVSTAGEIASNSIPAANAIRFADISRLSLLRQAAQLRNVAGPQTDQAPFLLRALRTTATEKATGTSAKVSGGEYVEAMIW